MDPPGQSLDVFLGQSWSLSLAFRSASELNFSCGSLLPETQFPNLAGEEMIGKAMSQ